MHFGNADVREFILYTILDEIHGVIYIIFTFYLQLYFKEKWMLLAVLWNLQWYKVKHKNWFKEIINLSLLSCRSQIVKYENTKQLISF